MAKNKSSSGCPASFMFRLFILSSSFTLTVMQTACAPQPSVGGVDKTIIVKLAEVKTAQAPIVKISGVLKRTREVSLSFRLPGVITKLHVDEGERVSQGQLLASVDGTAIRARTLQTQADVARTKGDMARATELARKGFLSEASLENQRAALTIAQAADDAAQFDQRWTNLVAPVSGFVLSRSAQMGEVVQAGQAIVTVADENSDLVMRLSLSDREISGVAIGDACEIQLSALPPQGIRGKIVRLGARVSTLNAGIPVEIAIADTRGLRSGLIGVATLKLRTTQPPTATAAVSVPAEAVLEANDGKGFVFVFDVATSTVRKTPVTTQSLAGDHVTVFGLEVGQKVVTAGASFVTNNDKVCVPELAPCKAGKK